MKSNKIALSWYNQNFHFYQKITDMKLYCLVLLFTISLAAHSQEFVPNYDESKIPPYVLPELLTAKNGDKIGSSQEWQAKRRKEILLDFEHYMYGKTPESQLITNIELVKEMDALNGKATMKEVRMTFSKNNHQISMDILIILPKSNDKVPLFLGLNFNGNHTISDDLNISLPSSWVQNNNKFNITDHKASENSRGSAQSRWPLEKIIDRGYGLATIYCGDIDPDKDDFSDGIHPLFYNSGQEQPAKDEWGTVAAWAWGLSRAMDYLETDMDIDASKIAVMGHSRLGKAALWAGANDERFAIVISNESGCGGAALSRRRIGETVGRINMAFPHWFCDNFNFYNNNEDALPFDQHMLIALMAPRPIYVASAEGDQWSDPKGEYLSAFYAGTVYQLFGVEKLSNEKMPDLNQPVMTTVGYHIRTGKHDVTDFDWEAYLDFAEMHFGE